LLVVWLIMVLLHPVAAQSDPLLIGPVLASNTVEQDAIILYDLANDTLRRVSFGVGLHHVWDFSPDGCRLLFTVRDGTGYARLWSMRLDGSDPQQMVRFDELPPERWGVWEPDWSGDASNPLIAFTMFRDQSVAGEIQQQTHIAYVSPDNPVPQFYSVTGREFSPVWSPAGDWLAYVSFEERVAGANPLATAIPTAEPVPGQTPPPATLVNEADLWMVQADGAVKYRLTNFPTGSVNHPRWSADGELVSFVYSPGANNDTVWMIANTPGSIATQLTYTWALVLDQTWLPDATAVIGSLRDFRDTAENRLWQLPLVSGGSDTNALPYLADAGITHADFPRFSPDGNYLAVRSAYELLLVDLQEQSARALDPQTLANSPAIWSPATFAGEEACTG
jgi:Tol biopolymer transport system component